MTAARVAGLAHGATADGESALLWQVNATGLPEPVPQFRFAPPRRWRFDLAWPDRMLAVEVEGGVWTAGRHVTGQGFTRDTEKYAEALCLGWRVLRVTSDQVRTGQALGWIERLLGLRVLQTSAQTSYKVGSGRTK